jgi:hypothetical protein
MASSKFLAAMALLPRALSSSAVDMMGTAASRVSEEYEKVDRLLQLVYRQLEVRPDIK